MNRSIDISLSSWQLGLNSPVLRHPYRPPTLRHADFEDKYDFHTVFYDCFWSSDGSHIQLIGPPLQNLSEDLHPRFFAVPSGEELTPRAYTRAFISSLVLDAPPNLQSLRVVSAAGTSFIVPQPNLSGLFAGRRVLMTLSQNNELEWIRDWIIHHQRLHGCDAALVYDNNSTRYDVSELRGVLASIPGVTGLAVNWPFRYGPFDGRLPLTYDLWEGHFCQFGMLEHARYRFLSTARCSLNLDIDELVICPGKASICDLTEKSDTGFLKFSGKWVEAYRSSGTSPSVKPLHRDFWHYKKGRTQGCENKYVVVPSRVPDSAQFGVHDIFGHMESELKAGIEIRHFKALNTNWAVDRPGSLQARTNIQTKPDGLAADLSLKKLHAATFAKTKRSFSLREPKDAETSAYQIRQRAAQYARTNRLVEAEAELDKAIATEPNWPSLNLYRANLLERQGKDALAKTSRSKATRRQDKDGRSYYQRARSLMHNGDWAGAARLFHRALRLSPGFASAYMMLGKLYWAAGRPGAAERIYRLGLERVPSSPRLHFAMAELLSTNGLAAEALRFINHAVALEPYVGNHYVLRAQILRTLKRPAEALASAEKAIALMEDRSICIQQLADAIDQPFESVFPYSDSILAQIERIRCLLQIGDLAAADTQSMLTLAACPNRPYPHEGRYLVLATKGDKKGAQRHLEDAIRLARRDVEHFPHQTLGRFNERHWFESRLMYLWYLLLCANRADEAIDVLEQGLGYYPESYITALRLSHLLASEGKSKQLKALIEDSVQRFPRNPDLWIENGRLFEASGDVQGAIESFRRAVRLGSRQAWLISHLAQLLIEQNNISKKQLHEAESLLRIALSLDDTDVLNHYRFGEVLNRKGDRTGALSAWQRAIELAPDQAWLWSHLGDQLLERRKLVEAGEALKRAEHLKPDDMLTQFRLGRLAEEQGNMDEARARMAKALAIDPSQSWAWGHYANLLLRMGRNAEAEKALVKSESAK